MDELSKLMIETQKTYKKSNKIKNKIIVLLIVLMFFEAVVFFSGFVYYESQFDYVTTGTQDIDIETTGDNANAEYNDVGNNQYNDNATHNEGGVE